MDRSPGVESQRRFSQNFLPPKNSEPPVDDYANLKGPSLLKKTLGLQRHRHGLYVGSSCEHEPALIRLSSIAEGVFENGPQSFRHVSERDSFLMQPDEGTKHYEEEAEDLDAIEAIVSPYGRALINLYFRIVHPSFPILHKKVYLEKYERTHREFSPAILAAVYILALNFWNYSSELASLQKPDVVALEELARKTLSYVINRPKISTVEAGLLLLQTPKSDSWSLIAQMVAVGQDLGLHLDCSSWKVPSWERGLRKRLAWALYMQDTWASLVHGRPSHIARSDWAVAELTEKDFPESAADEDDEEGSTEVEKGRQLFCHMVSLAGILSDVLQSLYSVRAEQQIRDVGIDATRFVLSKAKPLQIRLREWYTNLPEILNMEDVKVRKLSSTGYLHLAYFASEITLHRRILRTLPICNDPQLLDICRTAAKTRLISAMGFVNRLKPEHLQSFWYFASKFNFALIGTFQSLLCVTSQSKEEAQFYLTRIDEYRWTLRVSSKSAEFLEQSMATMDRSAKDLKTVCLDESRYTSRELDSGTAPSYEQSVAASYDDDYEPLQDAQPSGETMQSYFDQYPNQNFTIPDDFSSLQDKETTLWDWNENAYRDPDAHTMPENSDELV